MSNNFLKNFLYKLLMLALWVKKAQEILQGPSMTNLSSSPHCKCVQIVLSHPTLLKQKKKNKKENTLTSPPSKPKHPQEQLEQKASVQKKHHVPWPRSPLRVKPNEFCGQPASPERAMPTLNIQCECPSCTSRTQEMCSNLT